MSCAVSCRTDSGVRNPSTAITLVAAGGVGAAGAATGAGGGGRVSDAGGVLATRSHAAPTARAAHTIVTLIAALPSGSPGSTRQGVVGSPQDAFASSTSFFRVSITLCAASGGTSWYRW